MSAFKRREPTTSQQIKGTKVSPSNASLHLSSGSAAIDDLLGGSAGGRGGLGVGTNTINLIVETDPHSTYSDILLNYFYSQGLKSSHKLLSIGIDGRKSMWTSTGSSDNEKSDNEDSALDHNEGRGESKIAWRYENMKRFETSINQNYNDGDFLSTFDLTQNVPLSTINKAKERSLLKEIQVNDYDKLIQDIKSICDEHNKNPTSVLRIAIRNLGNWEYGDKATDKVELFKFIYKLRSIVRSTKYAAAYISTHSDNIDKETLNRLLYILDSCVTLESFSDAPHRAAAFAPNHGLIHPLMTSRLHSLNSPSNRHSLLRGGLVAGENNLAFKLRRRKLVVETLHLDVEGGKGERRTTPSNSSISVEETQERIKNANLHEGHNHTSREVEIESTSSTVRFANDNDEETPPPSSKKKGPRRVAFQSDKPELYEF